MGYPHLRIDHAWVNFPDAEEDDEEEEDIE